MVQLLKGKIEAVLFLTGRPLAIREIAEKLGEDSERVEIALLELIGDYSCREDSALEIDDAEGYILQVKETYGAVVHQMVPVNLSTAALRTLSVIALQNPILQSSLIQARGSSAYDHIKELMHHQLIHKRRKERSFVLSVTPKFYEYFKLSGDKEELKAFLSQIGADLEEKEERVAEISPS